MTLPEFTELFLDHCHGKREPVTVEMGTNALHDYIIGIEKIPFENRPYGCGRFWGALVKKNQTLDPWQIRFIMADGTSGDVFVQPKP